MALMARHLSVEDLEARFRASKDVVERSHCQAIWLLAKGHTTSEVAEIVALSSRWVRKLSERYRREGAAMLGSWERAKNYVDGEGLPYID